MANGRRPSQLISVFGGLEQVWGAAIQRGRGRMARLLARRRLAPWHGGFHGIAALMFALGAGTALASSRAKTTPPEKLKHVHPEYSAAACASGVEGDVLLECTRTSKGPVRSCRVVQGIPVLDDAAVKAAEQWVYVPIEDDRLVKLRVPFRLHDASDACRAMRQPEGK